MAKKRCVLRPASNAGSRDFALSISALSAARAASSRAEAFSAASFLRASGVKKKVAEGFDSDEGSARPEEGSASLARAISAFSAARALSASLFAVSAARALSSARAFSAASA